MEIRTEKEQKSLSNNFRIALYRISPSKQTNKKKIYHSKWIILTHSSQYFTISKSKKVDLSKYISYQIVLVTLKL